MVDSLAIGGYDPYFLQAYSSPNYYQMIQGQTPSVSSASNISFNGGAKPTSSTTQAEEPEKKSNAAAWAVLSTVATVGAAALCHKAGAVKGTKGFWKKIGDGAKEIGNNAFKKDFWKKLIKTSTDESSNVSRFSAVVNKDGSISYLIPGKNTTVKGHDRIAKYAEKHGIETIGLSINKETENLFEMLKKFDITIGKHKVTYKNGEIINISIGNDNIKGQKAIAKYLDNNSRLANSLDNTITKMKENDFGGIGNKILTNIEYQIQRGDDLFTVVKDNLSANNYTLKELTTLKRYDKGSREVQAYFFDNPDHRTMFENITSQKITEGLKPIQRPVTIEGITYQVKNGEIQSFTKNGKIYQAGSSDFKAEIGSIEKLEELTKKCNESATYPAGTIISF